MRRDVRSNGDLAMKLAAYRAHIHEVPQDVSRFL